MTMIRLIALLCVLCVGMSWEHDDDGRRGVQYCTGAKCIFNDVNLPILMDVLTFIVYHGG